MPRTNSGVQPVLDSPSDGLVGRLDLPGEVLHQLPQQLRLDLELILAAARRVGVGDLFDDCCNKPEAELEGISDDGLHLNRLVGSIRIYLVSADQKLAQIERRLGADDPQSSAFTERELSAETSRGPCLSEDIAMIWGRPSDRACDSGDPVRTTPT